MRWRGSALSVQSLERRMRAKTGWHSFATRDTSARPCGNEAGDIAGLHKPEWSYRSGWRTDHWPVASTAETADAPFSSSSSSTVGASSTPSRRTRAGPVCGWAGTSSSDSGGVGAGRDVNGSGGACCIVCGRVIASGDVSSSSSSVNDRDRTNSIASDRVGASSNTSGRIGARSNAGDRQRGQRLWLRREKKPWK